AKAPARVRVPAYAALSRDGRALEYLLLPDPAAFPLRGYRPTLARLLAFRRDEHLPPLVVATRGHARAAAWERMLREACRARCEAPLVARVACMEDLEDRLR